MEELFRSDSVLLVLLVLWFHYFYALLVGSCSKGPRCDIVTTCAAPGRAVKAVSASRRGHRPRSRLPEWQILIQFMIKHRTLHCNLTVRSYTFALNVDALRDYDIVGDSPEWGDLARNLFHLRKEEVYC